MSAPLPPAVSQPPTALVPPVSRGPGGYGSGPGLFRGYTYGYYDASNKQYWVVGPDGRAVPANAAEVLAIQAGGGSLQFPRNYRETQYTGPNGMPGYWDEQHNRYVVIGADGQERAATGEEAALIYANGGTYNFWPAGATRPTAPGTAPPDRGPQEEHPADWRPPGPEVNTVGRRIRPPVDTTWRQADQYNQIYGRTGGERFGSYFTNPAGQTPSLDEGFWNTAEGMPLAWARYISQEANPNSHYGRWLADQFNRVKADYVNEQNFDISLRYPDYVDERARGLANEYNALPGWQQGKNPASWWAGRRQ